MKRRTENDGSSYNCVCTGSATDPLLKTLPNYNEIFYGQIIINCRAEKGPHLTSEKSSKMAYVISHTKVSSNILRVSKRLGNVGYRTMSESMSACLCCFFILFKIFCLWYMIYCHETVYPP